MPTGPLVKYVQSQKIEQMYNSFKLNNGGKRTTNCHFRHVLIDKHNQIEHVVWMRYSWSQLGIFLPVEGAPSFYERQYFYYLVR